MTNDISTSTSTGSTAPTRVVPDLPQDPRPLFAHASELAAAVVAGVRPDQLGGPTPCDEFDVRRLVTHLVEVVQRVTAVGEGSDPMALPGVPDGLDLAGLRAAFDDGARSARDAFADDARLDQLRSLPWATMPGRAHLATYTNEMTVHTWDLAVATGQAVAWDDDVIALADVAIRAAFPPVRSAIFAAMSADLPAHLQGNHPWRDAIEAEGAVAPIDRLVAYNGRDPQWTAAGLEGAVSGG